GQKAASGGIQGDVLATDNNTVGMGDAGIKSAIQGSNVPNPDEAVPSFVSGAMAKAGKGLLEGTLQAGTSAVSDKLLDLVGLGRSEERFSRNAETDFVCRLLLEKKNFFWNEFYIDITRIPELERCRPAQEVMQSPEVQCAIAPLRRERLVHYRRGLAVKRRVLA